MGRPYCVSGHTVPPSVQDVPGDARYIIRTTQRSLNQVTNNVGTPRSGAGQAQRVKQFAVRKAFVIAYAAAPRASHQHSRTRPPLPFFITRPRSSASLQDTLSPLLRHNPYLSAHLALQSPPGLPRFPSSKYPASRSSTASSQDVEYSKHPNAHRHHVVPSGACDAVCQHA